MASWWSSGVPEELRAGMTADAFVLDEAGITLGHVHKDTVDWNRSGGGRHRSVRQRSCALSRDVQPTREMGVDNWEICCRSS